MLPDRRFGVAEMIHAPEEYKVCDGYDPDGNVFQLREAAR